MTTTTRQKPVVRKKQPEPALKVAGPVDTRRGAAAESFPAPELSGQDFLDYQVDLWQRTILFWDMLRQRADNMLAGDVDILLVPNLVSGNILAKNLEYLAGATAAGIVMGLSAPVVLSSRADPPAARLAALALAVLMHQPAPLQSQGREPESAIHCAAQPEAACCPMGA
jgi:hypothetical protein